jgi:hypothetical protein
MTDYPNLGLTKLEDGEVDAQTVFNENMLRLDLFTHLWIQDRDLTAPPGGENDGEVWLVNATGTGAWAGHDDELAGYYDGEWRFQPLKPGMVAYVEDETDWIAYDGAAWGVITVT